MFLAPTQGPGNGIFPGRYTVRATAREAITKGDVVQFSLDMESITEVDNNTPGSSDADGDNSGFNNVQLPDDTSPGVFRYGIFGVALEDIADNDEGEVLIYGIVNANVDGSTAVGSALIAATDGQLDIATTNGDKIIAIALEADTSNFADVWFSGVHPFGVEIDQA